MSWTNDELMAHALVGDLTPDQAAAWEKRCEADPDLRAEFEGLLPMVAEVEALPVVAFEGGFVERTMARVAAESHGDSFREDGADGADGSISGEADPIDEAHGVVVFSFDQALRKQFRWVASAAAAAAVVLLALNIGLFHDPEQTALEAALGLEPITIESVYSIGEGFGE